MKKKIKTNKKRTNVLKMGSSKIENKDDDSFKYKTFTFIKCFDNNI